MASTIEIVCAADERFAMPLVVTICSTAAKCSRPIRVFVLNTDLSDRSKKQIEKACAKSKNAPVIEWVDAGKNYLRDQPVGLAHLSQATYLRLGMGRTLPSFVKRAIYLDSDVLVAGDLAPMWDTPLDGNVVGAVRDFMTPIAGQANALRYCLAETGISPDYAMFNAGILLINLEAYRTQNIEAECVAFLEKWRKEIRSADQDALNAVLHDRVKRLDFKWNVQMGSWNAFKTNMLLSETDRKAVAEVDPVILHFSGSGKPWNSGLWSNYAKTYVQSVNRSGWYGFAGFRIWQAKRLIACVQTILKNRMAMSFS